MQNLAQVKSAKGKFVERKYLAMLNAPLDSSGTLVYTAPGRLEKFTDEMIRFHPTATHPIREALRRLDLACFWSGERDPGRPVSAERRC